MRREKNKKNDEPHYRHKLNMLEPGCAMLKICALLAAAGLVLYQLRCRWAYRTAFLASALLFIVLLVLISIELHQDKVLFELAAQQEDSGREP